MHRLLNAAFPLSIFLLSHSRVGEGQEIPPPPDVIADAKPVGSASSEGETDPRRKELRQRLDKDLRTGGDGKSTWGEFQRDTSLDFADFYAMRSNPGLSSELRMPEGKGLEDFKEDFLRVVPPKYRTPGLYLISYLYWFFGTGLPELRSRPSGAAGGNYVNTAERFFVFIEHNHGVVVYADKTIESVFMGFEDYRKLRERSQEERRRALERQRLMINKYGKTKYQEILRDPNLNELYWWGPDFLVKELTDLRWKEWGDDKEAIDFIKRLELVDPLRPRFYARDSRFLLAWMFHNLQRDLSFWKRWGIPVIDLHQFIWVNRDLDLYRNEDGSTTKLWCLFMNPLTEGGRKLRHSRGLLQSFAVAMPALGGGMKSSVATIEAIKAINRAGKVVKVEEKAIQVSWGEPIACP